MLHQLYSPDLVPEISRVQVGFDSPLRGAATPSAGMIEIRMTAQNASLSRVSEAIASLTNGTIPILVTTFTLFILIDGLRVPIPLSQCRGRRR